MPVKYRRPCCWLATVFAAGTITAYYIHAPLWIWLSMATCALAAVFFWRQAAALWVAVFLCGGLWMAQRLALPSDSIAFLSGAQRAKLTQVEGVIDSTIGWQNWVQGQKNVFDLNVRSILLAGARRPASGKVQVNVYGDQAQGLAYGHWVNISGKLHAAPETGAFSYRRYLQERGIYWMLAVPRRGTVTISAGFHGNVFYAAAFRVQAWAKDIFHRYLSPREAGFITAIVLGDRTDFPKDLKPLFTNTGTAHILAISGMNMAIVGLWCFFFLRLLGLSRRAQALGTVLLLFTYAFISGWSPSVVRACLMASAVLIGMVMEEEGDPLNTLGVAALILLAADPMNIRDIGFQLSFAAVGGILLFSGPIERWLAWLPKWLAVSLAVSLSACAMTAPLIAWHFHLFTPIAVLANIPVVPLADVLMVLGLGLAMTGGWCPALGMAFAACLKAALSLLVLTVGFFAHLTN